MERNKFNNKTDTENNNGFEENNGYSKKKYGGPRMMSKKKVEEAVCWILRDREYSSVGEKLKYVMYELRGKADSSLIRKVVNNYHW